MYHSDTIIHTRRICRLLYEYSTRNKTKDQLVYFRQVLINQLNGVKKMDPNVAVEKWRKKKRKRRSRDKSYGLAFNGLYI